MIVIDLVLPPSCAGCGLGGAVLCQHCKRTLPVPGDERGRFLIADPGVVVGDELQLGMAAFAYDGPVRRALGALKYKGAHRVAHELAIAGLPTMRRLLAIVGDGAVLVPVPLHARRERQRGYNQSALLARTSGTMSRTGVLHCLERERETVKQHRLNRAERLRNLRDAFVVVSPVPRIAILVDDIITTTATLEACANVLRTAGAVHVYGFAIAREL